MTDETKRRLKKPRLDSLAPIFRLLDTEGFTEHSAACVQRYNRRQATARARQMATYERNRKRFSEMAKGLSKGDRLILGKFIATREAMAFDAGLRIGLSASTFETEDDADG